MYSLQEIDLEMPRKKTVYLDVEDIEDYVPPVSDDTIKITVSGNYDDFKALRKTKKYKDLVNKVKIVFKPKKVKVPLPGAENKEGKTEENEDGNEDGNNTLHTEFPEILHTLINTEKNNYLLQVYELIINNKEICADDIMFL
jgi:hypothetical protein